MMCSGVGVGGPNGIQRVEGDDGMLDFCYRSEESPAWYSIRIGLRHVYAPALLWVGRPHPGKVAFAEQLRRAAGGQGEARDRWREESRYERATVHDPAPTISTIRS